MEKFGIKIGKTSAKNNQTPTEQSSNAGEVGDASFHWWSSDSDDDDNSTPSPNNLNRNQQSSKSACVVIGDESFNAKSRRPLGHEMSEEQEETVAAPSTVSFNVTQPDRLKLLVKLQERNILNVPCEITIGSNCVTLAGNQDLQDCVSNLLEKLCAFESVKVDVSSGVVKLLVSRDGEEWFDDQLAKRNLCAVCHDRGSACYVISESGASANRARELLESRLTSDVRQFPQQDDAVVSSGEWKNFVEQFRGMVLVTVRSVEREIVIDGCIDLVKEAGGKIDEYLTIHSRHSKVWRLERGVFDLLQMYRPKMEVDTNSNGAQQDSPKMRFDTEECSITLSGPTRSVAEAINKIERDYIEAVCEEKLILSLPGIDKNDFNERECGDLIVQGLQSTFKCSIAVSSHDGKKPKSTTPAPRSFETRPTPKSVSSNSSKIVIVKGNLVLFSADVLVNTLATGARDLSKAGGVAKAFSDVAGKEISQALGSNWPRDFGKDLAVTSAFNKQIRAKQIYHVRIARYRNSESIERLGSQISTCLKRAIADCMTSIAFPAVGCGNLKYDLSAVAEQFLKAERLYGQRLKIYVVVTDDETLKAFEAEIGKHQHPTEVSYSSVETSRTRPASQPEVEITLGTLAYTTADVLVNVIACKTTDLRKAGTVSKSLMDIAGDQLQTEFRKQRTPANFGKDIAVTSACGLPAKKIYHVAARARRNSESDKLLYYTICECLKMAARYRVSSIAFPTIGCGGLNYAPSTVIDCFNRAKRDTRTSSRILVVTPDEQLFRTLCSASSIAVNLKQDSHSSVVQAPVVSEDDKICGRDDAFVFTVRALDSSVVDEVVRELPQRLQALVVREDVQSETIKCLGTEIIRRIKTLESAGVSINIDTRREVITLMGKKSSVQKMRTVAEQILDEQEQRETNFFHIRKTKDSREGLRIIGCLDQVCYPKYWPQQQPGDGLAARTNRVLLTKGTSLYLQVEQLLTKTWEPDKVGHGNDALGLSHKNIAVKQIWHIVNSLKFKEFDIARKKICKQASETSFPCFNGLRGEREVLTRQAGCGILNENVVSEINEYYLLHGTKKETVKVIESKGFDFRVNQNGMMGRATYFAESSTKADQYADHKNTRVGVNQPLYMFVSRVVLGSVFVSRRVEKYVRPPCSVQNCPSLTSEASATGSHMQMICHDVTHKQFDSIVVTHKDANKRFLFREFVIYDNHCYPEFLVEYERLIQ